MIKHPFLDTPGPIAFAHRGGTSVFPENTLRAFDDAVKLGFRYVETDVHATSDGELVAFHDNDLARTCSQPWKITETTWDVLQSARVNNTDAIPLLNEILQAWPDLRINIDCKSDLAVEPLIKVLRDPLVRRRVCVGSFSGARLHRIRSEFGRDLCTSMGPLEVVRLVASAATGRRLGDFSHPMVAQIPLTHGPLPVTTTRLIRRAHDMGLPVHVWTIDSPRLIARVLDMGVDGVMSNDTRALKDVFVARNLW